MSSFARPLRSVSLAAVALALLAADGPEEQPEQPEKAAKPPLAPAPSFAVKVTGSGKPLLLIPGLGSSGDVWEATVAHFKDRYQCHAVTLAGFAGQPAAALAGAPYLETVRQDLARYVREKQLEKPILMGHSLGGFLVFALAASEPDLPGKVVAVDGVPFYPALFESSLTVEKARPQAEMVRAMMAAPRSKEFRGAEARQFLKAMITDEKQLDLPVRWFIDSDPATLAQAAFELLTTDLRDQAAAIRAPVLLLASVASAPNPDERAKAERAFRSQVEKVPDCRVLFAPRARHFIMFDEPEWFFREVEEFLAREGKEERKKEP